MMLSRLIQRPIALRFLALTFSNSPVQSRFDFPSFFPSNFTCFDQSSTLFRKPLRQFSNQRKNGDNGDKDPSGSKNWSFSPETGSAGGLDDGKWDGFGSEEGNVAGLGEPNAAGEERLAGLGDDDAGSEEIGDRDGKGFRLNVFESGDEAWSAESKDAPPKSDIFEEINKEFGPEKSVKDEWETAEGYEPWTFGEEEKGEGFIVEGGLEGMEGLSMGGGDDLEPKSEADKQVEKEEQELSAALKGPNRAFGDLIAASGITETMLESLIALKDLEGIEGLPPLREIEEARLAKNERKSTRAEMEKKKQEEIAKAHIRQVDEKGRAYGTGRRKCSVARVWVQPGDGKFIVNDKQFDVYFPILDHRADLLKPFVETKTLGLWDVKCTVKGGGVSGQVGAVRLGISRALQNWEPGLRPYLRSAGLLTRDPRVVERKKPGKAKARKSFQWVKR